MADGGSVERAAAGSFSEAQLEAIAGVVQWLLDKALPERWSGRSSVPASEEREAADKSGELPPVRGGIACKSRAAGRDAAVVREGLDCRRGQRMPRSLSNDYHPPHY